MSILVIGGTGNVGSQVVRGLLSKGASIRVLILSADKGKSLPKGAVGVVGNLNNPASLLPAMQGVEKVFLLLPLSPTEGQDGVAAVKVAKEAGVRHVVYLSVHNVEQAPHVPHFKSKIDTQAALNAAGLAATLIRADYFYQNDAWLKQPVMESGLYTQPIGEVGINAVDVRDIAEAAVNALTQPGHEGKQYPLVGPDRLTGPKAADTFSHHLGRPIRYAGNDLDAWEKQASQMMPDWLVKDLKLMFKEFQEHGLLATDQDLRQVETILGHRPHSYDAFVAEVTKTWQT